MQSCQVGLHPRQNLPALDLGCLLQAATPYPFPSYSSFVAGNTALAALELEDALAAGTAGFHGRHSHPSRWYSGFCQSLGATLLQGSRGGVARSRHRAPRAGAGGRWRCGRTRPSSRQHHGAALDPLRGWAVPPTPARRGNGAAGGELSLGGCIVCRDWYAPASGDGAARPQPAAGGRGAAGRPGSTLPRGGSGRGAGRAAKAPLALLAGRSRPGRPRREGRRARAGPAGLRMVKSPSCGADAAPGMSATPLTCVAQQHYKSPLLPCPGGCLAAAAKGSGLRENPGPAAQAAPGSKEL